MRPDAGPRVDFIMSQRKERRRPRPRVAGHYGRNSRTRASALLSARLLSWPSPSVRIGVDTGGTFTDFVCCGPNGMTVHKVRSTPADPSRAILEGIDPLLPYASWLEVIQGSTVATNAV